MCLRRMIPRLRTALSLSAAEGQFITTIHHRACQGGNASVLCSVLPLTGFEPFLDQKDELGKLNLGNDWFSPIS